MTDAAAALADSPKAKIVILAHPGTGEQVRRIWEKMTDIPVTLLEVPDWNDGSPALVPLLEDVMAMEFVDREFVLVPPNLVPVAPVRWSELRSPVVDADGNTRRFFGRTPVSFDKEALVAFLPDHDSLPADRFVQEYLKAYGTRPIEVGHAFGNYYTKVLRATPCENTVIEALIRKRFLFVSAAGWQAVAPLLDQILEK